MLRFSIKTLLIISFLTMPILSSFGQCNLRETITICDITSIDFDGDTVPDGIINLYDEYTNITGRVLDIGIWQTDPTNSFALDSSSGNLAVWNLRESTNETNRDRYTFQLFNTTCGDATPAVSINVVLGAFSGIALPAFGINNVNIEFCDSSEFDLFEGLISSGNVPPPHLNGNWTFLSTSDPRVRGVSGARNQLIEIPYQPGIPLVDQAVLEYRYDVIGNNDCTTLQSTIIRISVVRQVFSGFTEPTSICSSNIVNGDFDTDIDLRDDVYLEEEDIEGFWSTPIDPDTLGQIDDELDSNINFREIYNNLVINEGLRFGCKSYEFDYTVLKRSGVCTNSTTTLNFTLFEHLRPFRQTGRIPQICANSNSTFNLFDLLEFTQEEDIDFIYDDILYVNWKLVSGPSTLGILSQPELIEDFVPSINYSLGTINIDLAEPGIYTFRYGVSPQINCPISGIPCCNPFALEGEINYCETPCSIETAEVTIEILPFDYAGENTSNIELCEGMGSIDLRSLLQIDPRLTEIANSGIWRNSAGTIIDNNFIFPTITEDEEFTFTYNTIHPTSNCTDDSFLNFKIIKETPPLNIERDIPICTNYDTIQLFSFLEGTFDLTGTWTGPNGYKSADHIGEFISRDRTLILLPGQYVYTIPRDTLCNKEADVAIINIDLVSPTVLETELITATFCKVETSIDLLTLLPTEISKMGTFVDLDSTGAISISTVTFESLTPATYSFEYIIEETSPCPPPSLKIELTVLDEVEAGSAGEDSSVTRCSNDLSLNLFDLLGGSPEPTGTWSGPFGYRSIDHLGTFSVTNPTLVPLTNGSYIYTVGGGTCSTSTDTAEVTIEITQPIEVSGDISLTRCKSDASLSLFSILRNNTPLIGTFTALDITMVLNEEALFDFSNLPGDTYNFEYSIPNQSPCEPSIINIEIKIIDLEIPEIPLSSFCILDAKRLNDIEVSILNFNWYPTFDSDTPITNNPILIDNTTLYLANVDSENCESDRVEVLIDILNIGEKRILRDASGAVLLEVECPLELQDGVTPNNDGRNDSFVLIRNDEKGIFNIPEAFPNFELEIYNRFGTIVFEGSKDSEEFRGQGNRSLSLGNQLPSGVYFYVLKPNFKNNIPIQGSFYLSK